MLQHKIEFEKSEVIETECTFFLQDLQKILDNAKGGCVIYFSLGSNIKGTFLSAERLEMFRKTFENVDCTILWKFESNLANQPSNVIKRGWYPQHEILGLFSSRKTSMQNVIYVIKELDFNNKLRSLT